MSIESDMGIISFPHPIPTWPGRREYLPHYSAGWDAYGRHRAAVNMAWMEAQDAGLTNEQFRALGYSHVADPDGMVPAVLTGLARSAWCMGWCEHMAVNAETYIAFRQHGIEDPEALWQIAVATVNEIRRSYLSPDSPPRPPQLPFAASYGGKRRSSRAKRGRRR